MKNKGFTLIELLAVIVILAIILAIAVPMISSLIDNTKENATISNEKILLKAAKNYIVFNNIELDSIGDKLELTVNQLTSNHYLTQMVDPYNLASDCNGYVLVTKIGDTELDYTSHLKCGEANIVTNSTEDGLVLHYKFDDFQEPTFNGVLSPDFSDNIGGYTGITTERIIESQSSTGYALKINHVSVDNTSARIRFNVDPTFKTGTHIISVYAKAEGNFIGLPLRTYTGTSWYYFEGGLLEADYKRFWIVATTSDTSGGPVSVSTRTLENGTYYVHSPQIETKQYLTPFTTGTRMATVNDYSINSNTSSLSLSTAPKWILGKSGAGAYEFNGTSNVITSNSISLSTNLTACLWVKPYSSAIKEIMIHGNSTPVGFELYQNNTAISLRANGWSSTITTPNVLSLNNWSHVCATIENTVAKIYINGALSRIGTVTTPSTASAPLNIGAYNSLQYPYHGALDDIRIYNRTLSESEIKLLYRMESNK